MKFAGIKLRESFEPPDPIIASSEPVDDSIAYYRSKAAEYTEEVTRRGALIGNLNDLSLVELPVGLTPIDGNPDYTVIITSIRVTPQGAYLEAYCLLTIPFSEKKIAFRGTDIGFSYAGGLTGEGRLELVGDYDVANGKVMMKILGRGNTFVDFDCNGFEGMGLEASIEFSRDLIIPENEDGSEVPPPKRVETRIATYMQSWNDLLLEVNLPPFQISRLNGVGFKVSRAFLDWSDLANPPGLILPTDYDSPFPAGNQNLWRGFFLQRLEIRLPPSFSKKDANRRVTVAAENVILDDSGLTGSVLAENILSGGNMNGWSYSIDKVSLDLKYNQVKGFHFQGMLSVPMIKSKDRTAAQFEYLAQRGADGNYLFATKVSDEAELPLWGADVSLFRGSTIVVREFDKKFYPSATLNGELTIRLLNKAPKAAFNSIRFEGMIISSSAPHFVPGTFGFGSEEQSSTVAKYPVVISDVDVRSDDNKVGLGFKLSINIGEKPEDEGFSGSSLLVVWGVEKKLTDAEGQPLPDSQDWVFDHTEIDAVAVIVKKAGIDLEGSVQFFHDDPMYGDGFNGSLEGKLSKITVEAYAVFGRTPTFRYWFADARILIDEGIPISPGLSVYGFGGGYYSRMKQSEHPVESGIGKTASGLSYIPDEHTKGIRAMVMIGAKRPEAFYGDVTLQVVLNDHGGINAVTFTGNALFMNGPLKNLDEQMDKLIPLSVSESRMSQALSEMKGQVFGHVLLHYDHINEIFHGNIEIYINVAGGIVRGVGSGSRAGWATIHFEHDNWYILIGTPDDPIGLEVARIFKAESYFMLGKDLPGSPPPPPQVSEILGNIDLDYMRDFNALQSGTGFAFGLHFLVDTGDLHFLMFYARFSVGTGLDMMLKDYGDTYHCEDASGPMGIDGWYANGQAYAFIQGKIGIHVHLTFYKGNFDILSIGAAAIMQARGPNPFWMQGNVGGYYRILGGLVKGHCHFKVTVGKECKPVGEEDVLEGLKMIAGIAPEPNAKQVDVFSNPQVAFNIPIGEDFSVNDIEGNHHVFRALLDDFTVRQGQQELGGTQKWNNEKDVVAFETKDLLPGKSKLTAQARLTFEEKSNGTWSKVHYQGKEVEEDAKSSFETGDAPNYIPASNVESSWPIIGQVGFLKNESDVGFIRLKRGQPYLFEQKPEWKQTLRFINKTSDEFNDAKFEYNIADRQIEFSVAPTLRTSTNYYLKILDVPSIDGSVDYNVGKQYTALDISAGADTITTKNISGELVSSTPLEVFSMEFRTSKFSTFQTKMKSIKLDDAIRQQAPDPDVYLLTAYFKGDEAFEPAEFIGTTSMPPLLQSEAILDGNKWYEKDVYPLVYEGYPLMGQLRLKHRDPAVHGLPPDQDMTFDGVYSDPRLDQTDMMTPVSFTYERITYRVSEDVITDFKDLRNQAANYFIDHPLTTSTRLKSFIAEPAPWLPFGNYRVRISYRVPESHSASTYTVQLFNHIRINR